jgi:hypothetical protein
MPAWSNLLIYAVAAGVIIFRTVRPQTIGVTRLWVAPLLLCGLLGFAIYGTAMMSPAPVWEVVAGLLVGVAAGVPFGILRGRHTEVKLSDRPGKMHLSSSWITAVVWLGAFGLRAVIRYVGPHHGSLSATIGDALLAFAIGMIATSYLVIFQKYQALRAASLQDRAQPA